MTTPTNIIHPPEFHLTGMLQKQASVAETAEGIIARGLIAAAVASLFFGKPLTCICLVAVAFVYHRITAK